MRTPQNKNHDLSKPFEGSPVGCWGKEWKPGCYECNICADNASCAIIYNKSFEPEVNRIEDQEKFLDRVNFDLVNFPVLLKEIKANPYLYSVQDLIDIVQQRSGCKDLGMVKTRLKRFITENKIEDGYIK